MADFIIIVVLAVIVFCILRGHFRKLRSGQCSGGCAGCPGCGSCSVNTSGKSAGSGCRTKQS